MSVRINGDTFVSSARAPWQKSLEAEPICPYSALLREGAKLALLKKEDFLKCHFCGSWIHFGSISLVGQENRMCAVISVALSSYVHFATSHLIAPVERTESGYRFAVEASTLKELKQFKDALAPSIVGHEVLDTWQKIMKPKEPDVTWTNQGLVAYADNILKRIQTECLGLLGIGPLEGSYANVFNVRDSVRGCPLTS